MDRSDERRKHPRIEVFAGNAEITKVIGRGRKPGSRARIVNWSRGGMLLRVPSPRRFLVFFSQKQAVHAQDAIACTLRLPPAYKNIEIMGEVVRAERVAHEPDLLEVAMRFSEATHGGGKIDELAALLEPKHMTSYSQRMPAAGKSGRVSRQSGQVAAKAASQPLAKNGASGAGAAVAPAGKATSQKGKPVSQKLPATAPATRVASQKVAAKGASQRVAKAASERVVKAASERVVTAASERVAKRASQRVVATSPEERPSARGQRMSSQRLAAVPASRSSQRSKQPPTP